jgi:MFS family permease
MELTVRANNLRTPLFGVGGMFLVNGLFVAVLAAYFPLIKAQLDADEATFAICLTALGLGALISMAFSGYLVGRFGSARVTLVTAMVCGALFALQAFLFSLPLAVATLFALGAANGMTDIAMNVQASTIEQKSRANYMTRIHACWSIGGIAGSLLAGAIIERLPPAVFTMVLSGFYVLAVSLATSAFLPDERRPQQAARTWALPPSALLPFGLMAFLVLLSTGGIRDWSAVYLNKDLGSSLSVAVQVFAAFSATTALGRLGGDAIRSRIGNTPLLIAGGVAGFLAMAAGLASGSVIAMFAAVAALGFAHANMLPVLISAAGKFDPGHESRNVSAVMATAYGGYILGPPLIGLAASTHGLTLGLGIVSVASLLIAAVGAATRR